MIDHDRAAIISDPTWRVTLRATWDDDELPPPIAQTAVPLALGHGIRLTLGVAEYTANFSVEADSVDLACRAALDRHARLVELARLPLWSVTALEVRKRELTGLAAEVDLRNPIDRSGEHGVIGSQAKGVPATDAV